MDSVFNILFAIVLHLVLGVVWFLAVIVTIVSFVETIRYCIGWLSDGNYMQEMIPAGIISFAIACFPLYLESVTNEYVVLDHKGEYLHTIKPNLPGFWTQYEWDKQFRNQQQVINADYLVCNFPNTVDIHVNETNAFWVRITFSDSQFSNKDLHKFLISRAQAIAVFGKTKYLRTAQSTRLIVEREIINSPEYPVLSKILASGNTDPSLSKKISILTALVPINEKLVETYGIKITDFQLSESLKK